MLLTAALLGLALVVGFVVLPLARPAASPDEVEPTGRERRDRALPALRELEFDHRTGKITDEDYAEVLGPLRAEAAAALQAVAE